MNIKFALLLAVTCVSPICRAEPPGAATNKVAVARFASSLPSGTTFDWREVESADYRTYVKNLQTIGCPPLTIREIVTADVVDAFAGKRGEALAERYADFKYWKAEPEETQARAALQKRRGEIDGEMKHLLRQLLGAAVPLPEVSREWRGAELDLQLAFLPAEKRPAVRALLLEHQSVDQQVKELAANINVSEDPAELAAVIEKYEAKKASLQELLTPAECRTVELTTSWTAENLRRAMVHFHPTAAEFEAVFDAWQPHDEKLARHCALHEPDPGIDPVYDEIKQHLSEARYDEYCSTWWQ